MLTPTGWIGLGYGFGVEQFHDVGKSSVRRIRTNRLTVVKKTVMIRN